MAVLLYSACQVDVWKMLAMSNDVSSFSFHIEVAVVKLTLKGIDVINDEKALLNFFAMILDY